MRFASILLKALALAPLVYLASIAVAAYLWPDYDHMTQTIAALGSAAAPKAQLFNYGMMAAGGLTILGALGAFLGMRKLNANILWSLLTVVALALWGGALVQGGLHPVPDPMHEAYGVGLAIIAAPLLMFLGLAGRSDMGGLKGLLLISFLTLAGLWAARMNIGGLDLIQPGQMGLWERGYALAAVLWISVAALAIDQRMSAKASRARDEMRRMMFSSDAS